MRHNNWAKQARNRKIAFTEVRPSLLLTWSFTRHNYSHRIWVRPEYRFHKSNQWINIQTTAMRCSLCRTCDDDSFHCNAQAQTERIALSLMTSSDLYCIPRSGRPLYSATVGCVIKNRDVVRLSVVVTGSVSLFDILLSLPYSKWKRKPCFHWYCVSYRPFVWNYICGDRLGRHVTTIFTDRSE